MAGIQTVDSAGKVTLALLNIDGLMKNGNTSQAKSNALWLKNELAKMKLTEANKEIQAKTTALNKAQAETARAKDKLTAATLDNIRVQEKQRTDHFIGLETEKRESFEELTDEKLANIKAQSELATDYTKSLYNVQLEAEKDKWANRREINEDVRRDITIKRIQEKIDSGETLTDFETQYYNEAVIVDSGLNTQEFFDRGQTQRQRTQLHNWIAALEGKQDRTPNEDIQLYMMKMAAQGQLEHVNAQTLSEMHGWLVTEDEINELKRQITAAAQTRVEPSLQQMRETAAREGGVEAPETPASTEPTFAPTGRMTHREAQLRDKVDDLREHRAAPDRYKTIVEDRRERDKTALDREKMQLEHARESERIRAETLKGLPEGLATVEYFRRQVAASPTDANKQLLADAVSALKNAPYLQNDYTAALSYLQSRQKDAQQVVDNPASTEAAKKSAQATVKFYQRLQQEIGTKGVPKQSTAGTSSTSKKKASEASTSALNKYDAHVGEYKTALSKGYIETATPEERLSMFNSHDIISSLNLPTTFKINKNNAFDTHVGAFKWGDTKTASQQKKFAASFLNQLTTELRTQGFTPQDVQRVLSDFDKGRNILGSESLSTVPTGVNAMIYTYANISKHQSGVLQDFRKQLTKFAQTQGIKESGFTEAGDAAEKVMALWQGFEGWNREATQATAPQSASASQARKEPFVKGQRYRMYDRNALRFREFKADKLVRDSKGNVTHILSGDKRIKVSPGIISTDANLPVPGYFWKRLPAGTPVIAVSPDFPNGLQLRVYRGNNRTNEFMDAAGNIRRISQNTVLYLPGNQYSTQQINRLLRGDTSNTSAGAKQMLEHQRPTKPADPFKPNANKPTNGAQKKNKGPVAREPNAATLTWETLKGGGRVVRLDAEGRAFASVLNLRAPGQKGRDLPGFYDGDTIMSVEVELPDLDRNAMPDDTVELEGGARVRLPDAWKSQEYTPGDGAVYTKGTRIRLSGYFAEEVYLPDKKTLNPVGVRAQQALVEMFRQGWTDAKESNRFIFKARVVGVPNKMEGYAARNKRYANPYIDSPKYNRVVTDVYVAIGGTEKKVAEITWVNPVDSLSRQGHGENRAPWRLK